MSWIQKQNQIIFFFHFENTWKVSCSQISRLCIKCHGFRSRIKLYFSFTLKTLGKYLARKFPDCALNVMDSEAESNYIFLHFENTWKVSCSQISRLCIKCHGFRSRIKLYFSFTLKTLGKYLARKFPDCALNVMDSEAESNYIFLPL